MHFKCLLRWDAVCLLIQLSARKGISTYPKCQDFPVSHWGSWCSMPPLFGSLLISSIHLLPIDGFLTSAHRGLLPFPKQDFLVPGLFGKDDGEWGKKTTFGALIKELKGKTCTEPWLSICISQHAWNTVNDRPEMWPERVGPHCILGCTHLHSKLPSCGHMSLQPDQ